MPLYVVTDTVNAATRLIDAPNPAQALRHVTIQQFAVKVASAALVAKLMGAGVKLESIAAEAQPECQPEGY
jgi:ribosome biogenesis SPOUT family RNA methylase Rps3